jgi:hypothetical protein
MSSQEVKVKIYGLFSKKQNKFVYIGITVNTLHVRRLEHLRGKKLESRDTEIVELGAVDTKREAALIEAELIVKYDTINNGLNKSPFSINGYSNSKPEEERARISAALKGRAKPKSEVLARIGKKKQYNGLPANIQRALSGSYKVVVTGSIDGKKSGLCFGHYKSLKDAKTVAGAAAKYAVENDQVMDGFSHPLWSRQQRKQTDDNKGIYPSKYGSFNVQLRCKVSKKLHNFKSYKTLEEATKVRNAALAFYSENGTFEGFVIPA